MIGGVILSFKQASVLKCVNAISVCVIVSRTAEGVTIMFPPLRGYNAHQEQSEGINFIHFTKILNSL